MSQLPKLPLLRLAASLALVINFHSLVQAQQTRGGAESADEAIQIGQTRFLLDFPGGTVLEFIEHLETAADDAGIEGPLNIVITDSVREFRLPSIEIKTNIEGALGCLVACSTDHQEVIVDTDDTGTVTFLRMADTNPPIVQVMNVKGILKDMKQEDFVSAIGIGLEMAGDANGRKSSRSSTGLGGGGRSPGMGGEEDMGGPGGAAAGGPPAGRSARPAQIGGVTMKLHEETGLFFVKGPPERIRIIEQVVSQLGANPWVPSGQNLNQQGNWSPGNAQPTIPRESMPTYDPRPQRTPPQNNNQRDQFTPGEQLSTPNDEFNPNGGR